MLANSLTLLRLVLVAPFAAWMLSEQQGDAWLAAAALVLAIATDLLDGPLARRRATASAFGRIFDHGTDFLFVVLGLAACAVRGTIPVWLPALIVIAFAQYVIDSYWLRQARELRMSSLGRWNGILYFVPLVGDVGARLYASWLAPIVHAAGWLLVVSTLLSIADRLLAHRSTPDRGNLPS